MRFGLNGQLSNGIASIVFAPNESDMSDLVDCLNSGRMGGHTRPVIADPRNRLGEHSTKKIPTYRARQEFYEAEIWKATSNLLSAEASHRVLIVPLLVRDEGGAEHAMSDEFFGQVVRKFISSDVNVHCILTIDDVYRQRASSMLEIHEQAIVRHLTLTKFDQLTRNTLMEGEGKLPGLVISLQHPVSNFLNAVVSFDPVKIYLCHPINVFRRNAKDENLAAVTTFKRDLFKLGIVVLDPLGIDEEVLISDTLGRQEENHLVIAEGDRITIGVDEPLSPTSSAKLSSGNTITIAGRREKSLSETLKSQVPRRDFDWIARADGVIAWRPFMYNKHHAGVLSELQYAHHNNIPVFAFHPRTDGQDHPSPFASMTATNASFDEFWRNIEAFVAKINMEKKQSVSPPKYCDHTSVGILIYNDKGEVLLIDRNTFPFHKAPPAGHVDEHQSFEEAAIAEAREEVGLVISNLQLVAEGRRENPCRRVNGSWHYWKIYKADAIGEIVLSPREAKSYEWCSPRRLRELELIDATDAEVDELTLEDVWKRWFKELAIL